MKQLIITFALATIMTAGLSAQVTIGSTNAPYAANLLQIESDGGLGLPRVQLVSLTTVQPFLASATTAQKTALTGLMVYNLTDDANFDKGVYVWNGTKWEQAGEGAGGGTTAYSTKRWFYMPAFNLPMQQKNKTYTYDLYAEYQKQFTKSGNALFNSNSTTIATVPHKEDGTIYARTALNYAVLYYDATILTVTGINNNGVLSYKVLDNDPADTSFMTVVFIVK